MISHIDHIVLTVSDIENAVAFYEKVLEMEAITFAEGRRAVRFGEQKINFQLLGQELRNHAMEGSGDICLITHWSLEKLVAHLQACEVTIIEGPVAKSGATGPIQSVYFNDPDNNLIEVSVLETETTLDPRIEEQ
ncbi:VOC family protein [Marinomonas posidonica]|uniref:Glyoxalase/bleomycin resistance protein/dioxygenase n=1 Tax=Marinomonas posidonica (strain CECT 7376 / NCIMB 14433 / IVIA-Po-181) TaxID=491952 RepID=F6CVJ5_MARPP|nr:VOC family protein [Marinomonas posidonica]AEF55372.1 Glyoxalase/bleomycin resistance protein/dioxygenase [Marinomonas posidonica IVIA-Po-181]